MAAVAIPSAGFYNWEVNSEQIRTESEPQSWPGVKTSIAFSSNGLINPARCVHASCGAAMVRVLLDMCVEMGILQLEIENRPDGQHPEGSDTYFDYLLGQAEQQRDGFELNQDQCERPPIGSSCNSIIAAFAGWPCGNSELRGVRCRSQPGVHGLRPGTFAGRGMDPSYEQYRPFVLFHRTQATPCWPRSRRPAPRRH